MSFKTTMGDCKSFIVDKYVNFSIIGSTGYKRLWRQIARLCKIAACKIKERKKKKCKACGKKKKRSHFAVTWGYDVLSLKKSQVKLVQ